MMEQLFLLQETNKGYKKRAKALIYKVANCPLLLMGVIQD